MMKPLDLDLNYQDLHNAANQAPLAHAAPLNGIGTYEAAFGLNANPFTLSPDPAACYMTDFHAEALAGLHYAIMRRRGFVVLVGEAGTGKTTLLRRLLDRAPREKVHHGVIVNPTIPAADFVRFILFKLGVRDLPYGKVDGLIRLESLLMDMEAAGKIPVLVIDEAHKLSLELLEEVRLLTNFENNDHKLLQIVLAGQPELTSLLNRPDLAQLKQRIGVRTSLRALNCAEIERYIAFRWQHAGGSLPVPFEESVFAQIVTASRGIPRVINAICDNALLVAFASDSQVVKLCHVREVLDDLGISRGERARVNGPILSRVMDSQQASVRRPLAADPETGSPEPGRLASLGRWAAHLLRKENLKEAS